MSAVEVEGTYEEFPDPITAWKIAGLPKPVAYGELHLNTLIINGTTNWGMSQVTNKNLCPYGRLSYC